MISAKPDFTREKLTAISNFSARIVHDLNNFSTIIVNVCELIKDDIENNPEALVKIKMVEEAGARLLDYTAELNSFRFRNDVGPHSCSVNQIISEIAKGQSAIHVLCDPAEPYARISGEGFRFIIQELVNNALEASPENPSIYVESKLSSGTVNIVVRDQGKGLNAEQLAHLGEPYFSSKANVKGSGVSLPKIYALVNNCGGNINFSSVEGAGTTVSITIPVAPTAAKSPDKKAELIEVLLVDDQDVLRKVAKEILTKNGYKVHEAANGTEALALGMSAGNNISLLITDLVMPSMGGLELAEKLHERFSKLKVLLMSGYPQDESGAKKSDKNTAFINKPFTKDLLLSAVEKILH